MRRVGRAWLELAGFWAIAIAHPVLDASVSGPDALTQLHVGRLDVFVLLIVTMAIAPTLLLAIELAIARFSRPAAGAFHAVVLAALVALVVWQGAFDSGLSSVARLFLPLLAGVLVAVALGRSVFARQMALVLGAIATPVVAVAFLFSGPVADATLPVSDLPDEVHAASGTPVVVLILDEFPLAALTDRVDRIDADLFPHFAELAANSTWYRNARTVDDFTVAAVPAILSGKVPSDGYAAPTLRRYPDNLFTEMLAAGYGVSGQEEITDLCPHSACAAPSSRLSRLARELTNGAAAQPFPQNLASRFATKLSDALALGETPEEERFDEFIERLEPNDSRLTVAHIELPHFPWYLLPTGQTYDAYTYYGLPTDQPEVDYVVQRIMLQARYVDAMLGKAIARMKAIGLWKHSLFAVVADHGASLRADIDRRPITTENTGWVLPVPLFVKYPGQRRGKVVSRTATTTQLLATILKSVGLERPDGTAPSLRAAGPTPRMLRVRSRFSGLVEFPERDVRKRFRPAVHYRNHYFGDGSFYAVGGHPELLGRPVAGLGLKRVKASVDERDALQRVDPHAGTVPAAVGGEVLEGPKRQRFLAFALNGRVVATGHSWQNSSGEWRFATMIPVVAMRPGANRFEVFALRKK